MKKLNDGERCIACERVLANIDGGPVESLHEYYDAGNHVCESAEPKPSRRQLFRKGIEIGALAEDKRDLYGDSAAQYEAFLRLLWPNGVPLSSARDAGLMLRVFDKFMRIATSKEHDGENPWDDAAGYALIGAAGERKGGAE